MTAGRGVATGCWRGGVSPLMGGEMAEAGSPWFAMREGRLGRVLLVLMAIGFAALIAAGVVVGWVQSETERHGAAVEHTYRVELAIADTRRLIEQSETARRGYLLSPDDPRYLDTYRNAAGAIPRAMRRLRWLVNDNPEQRRRHDQLVGVLRPLVAARDATVDLVAAGRIADARAAFRAEADAARLMSIRTTMDAMGRSERALLVSRNAEQRRSVAIFYTVLLIAGVLVAVVAIISLLTVTRYTQDLAASRDAIQQLNEGLEDIVSERTADLSRANDEIQRFAYIVSHDLRSPLVNVMGFTAELEAAAGTLRGMIDRAESEAPALVTDDERFAAREDLPEAIGFIRTSTQKMDRLINAILSLSRQGRRVLAPEPLDLAALIASIRDSLAHRLDEEGAEIAIAPRLPSLVCDRVAIEQILSNLIENAVKYRHPARPVRVEVSGGELGGGRLWIEVRDNGRGIDPRDHDRVFDLFRRSGTQDRPGEGIGLAHVRALAYRLGGTIELRSTLGEGSAFRLTLPQAPPETQEPAR